MGNEDLSDVLLHIQMLLEQTEERHNTDLRPRTINWAIAVLERDGYSRAFLGKKLENRTLKSQWYLLRQLLSPKRLRQLDEKLTTEVMSLALADEHEKTSHNAISGQSTESI